MTIQTHVFLSYTRHDDAIMQQVRSALIAEGINVWTDEFLEVGTNEWERSIEHAIKNCAAFIVILSPEANSSKWVRSEITYAETFRKQIFPLLARGDEQTSIPVRLITYQWIDGNGSLDKATQRLADVVCKYIGIEPLPEKLRAAEQKIVMLEMENKQLQIQLNEVLPLIKAQRDPQKKDKNNVEVLVEQNKNLLKLHQDMYEELTNYVITYLKSLASINELIRFNFQNDGEQEFDFDSVIDNVINIILIEREDITGKFLQKIQTWFPEKSDEILAKIQDYLNK